MKRKIAIDIEKLYGYIFILPAVAYMIILVGYPIIYNITMSFQNVDVMTVKSGIKEWVGINNYKELFQEGTLFISMKNTLVFTIRSLFFQFVIGFLLALFFNKRFRMSKPIRGLMLISWMMPIVVTSLLFKFMLSPSNGIINNILIWIHVINEPIDWLIESNTALWGVVMANAWVGIPFNITLLTTGLTNIPEELYESASIDGANNTKKFFYITLPLLKQAILSVLMLGFIYTFKVFDLVFVMTNGGPINATELLSTFAYKLSFKSYSFSQGATVATILFICLLIVSLIYLNLIKEEEVVK